ncbi:HEXXH motif-containing putative peptide modification protein [Streptomyces sp. V4I2]|uniref:aKG-HExxH-type peptide beta-hydroxylase n=1 Tax=Streptomyces sp. V4I2 TaxID=3042280 RepID=UPI0027865B37|nr:HEXXH motif-containing putative peptide modification protein [Streptomyces sp. V4I2]MDQ1049654.1 HEXXH motif-containing protein [Streptomyces sp. V4I2]
MQEPRIAALAQHLVFAEAAGILNRLYQTYDFLLECVAPESWPAGPDGYRIAVGTAWEPTVRHRLDQALRHIRNTPDCKAELTALSDSLRSRPEATLAAEEERAGIRHMVDVSGNRVDLLVEPALPAPGHREFTALFRRHLSAGEGADRLTRITAHQAEVAHQAVQLMLATAPELCAGLLRHARYVVAVDGPNAFDSASTREIPGAAFVAARCMRTPERLAEALVHEFVHMRLYDLQLTRSIFAPSYDTATAPTVAPEWHRHSQVAHWPVDRALAAAHVYVHLSAWFEQRVRDCPDPDLEQSAQTTTSRASSLLGKVTRHADSCLGPAGIDFVRWLSETHQRSTAPRPTGERVS